MPKRHVAPITSGRVTLRLLEQADLPTTLAWRNQDHIRQWFFSPGVIAPAQHQSWFERYQQRDDDFVFVIEETGTLNRPVGQAALYHIDWAAGRAEFGRLMIGEADARGLGLARLATDGLVSEALSGWGLQEVYLECMAGNLPALAVYRACGFQETERRADVVLMRRQRPA